MAPEIAGVRLKYEKNFYTNPDRIGNYLIQQIGEQLNESGFSIPEHEQWCYEISYVLQGKGLHIVNGVEYPVCEGDIFITPLHSRHSVRAVTPLHYLFLGFSMVSEETDEELRLAENFFRDPPLLVMKAGSDISKQFCDCLDEYYSDTLGRKTMTAGYISALLFTTVRTFMAIHIKNYRSELTRSEGFSVYAVILYIESNIFSIPDIRDIMKKFNYSRSYLSHAFRQQTGITLQQYLAKRKIEESVSLVRRENLSFTAVSERIGFSSPQAYTKAFKRVMGVPPSVYFHPDKEES